MNIIKTESKNGYVSSVQIQAEDDLNIWFDVWAEDVGTRTELTGDWNKYIFQVKDPHDKRTKTFQETEGNFEKCLELAIEEYDRYQDFRADGYYTIANSGGYEVELSNDGTAARLKDCYGNINPNITDWLVIEDVDHKERDFETIPTIDPKGYHIPLNLVISF